ncbi:hypothetical protein [Halioxenophilus aromaticivorans]|uniref:DUF4402 domain-containing protein n=1 Tax=Halioxenophilus aromaticivorans TaxID=1306992 RepID=A0AAV3U0A9_9ALTE
MNKPLKKLCLASGVALAFGAQADTFNVTATVDNAITLTETTPFSIGSLFLTAETDNAATPASMSINSNGDVTTTPASGGTAPSSSLVSLGGATAGVITITGAAPFTDVTVEATVDTDDHLTHFSGSPNVPAIEWVSITAYDGNDPTGNSETVLLSAAATGFDVTTDGSGNADILVGGVLQASIDAANTYEDGSYTGTYNIDVSY